MKTNLKRKLKLIALFSMTIPLLARAQDSSVEKLQTTVSEMQKTISNLQQQITDLKRQPSAAVVTTTPPPPPSTNGVVFVVPTINNPQPAEVRWREVFRDYQDAAPRPSNKILDPKFRGYIPIPNTPAFVRFDAKPRVDVPYDNRNPGNLDRFVPAQIPVESEPTHGGGRRFNVNA